MAPTAYTSFAAIGAGMIGLPIVQSLAAKNISLILLSRPNSTTTPPPGVEVIHVDYTDVAAVSEVFKKHKIQVVVSNVAIAAVASQKSLIDAAKLAGVELFVASEYAGPTDGGITHPAVATAEKNKIGEYLTSVGLPSLRIFTGPFTEGIPWLTSYDTHKKVLIRGTGDVPVSYTSIPDIAGFVAHVLTTLPPAQLHNRIFRLEGGRATFKELATEYYKTTFEHVKQLPEGPAVEMKEAVLSLLESGAGSTGWDDANKRERTGDEAAGSGNRLWEGHKWQGIRDVLKL
ncbi:NmrA domain-containing protein [Favolaschia claudopus]|uniref:NmrA domain-containing protein n=1 Tax=Favolaschia claudopus TaxID=2862362 RepID=A0AAW0D461_9AGAR